MVTENDKLFGGAGNYTILAGDGIDTLNGQKGTDTADAGVINDLYISIEVIPFD